MMSQLIFCQTRQCLSTHLLMTSGHLQPISLFGESTVTPSKSMPISSILEEGGFNLEVHNAYAACAAR